MDGKDNKRFKQKQIMNDQKNSVIDKSKNAKANKSVL